MPKKPKEYALYKGDKLIYTGTAEEIAKHEGVKVSTVYYYQSGAYGRRTNPDKARRLILLED